MGGTHESADRELLFAYGTLVRGGPRRVAAAMLAHARPLGPASVAGRLYDSGDWPALLPAVESADRVPGCLFEVLGPRRLWPVLDAWEGCGEHDLPPHLFRRERVEATTAGGGRLQAWAYRFGGEVEGWPRIDRWPPPGAAAYE